MPLPAPQVHFSAPMLVTDRGPQHDGERAARSRSARVIELLWNDHTAITSFARTARTLGDGAIAGFHPGW